MGVTSTKSGWLEVNLSLSGKRGGKSHLGTKLLSAVSEIWRFCMVICSLLPISMETMHDPKEPVLLIALKSSLAKIALAKLLWQKLHDTPDRAAQPDSHPQQPNAKPLAHAQLSNTFWFMPNATFKEQEQVLRNRTDTIHIDKHTKRLSHTTGPATCPLCGRSDSAPLILLRCNNHTLKRMHINRHHHAVPLW